MPSRTIWVSTEGQNSNDGAAGSPVRTIQRAIEMAEPGTKVAVKAGVYAENIMIRGGVNPALNSLTADNPLEIVSADGVGAAVIRSADAGDRQPTVSTIGMSHLRIAGFEIEGDVVETSTVKDGGPLKMIGDPSGPAENPSTNVVIEDNIFTGVGVSMIKVTKTSDVEIVNNTFEGRSSENHIDMVTVWDTSIEANDFVGPAKIGITMKGGSQDNTIRNNLLDFGNVPGGKEQAGVQVGGVGASRLNREPLPAEFSGFEAKNVDVIENVIVTDTETAVWLQGAADSRIEGNLLGASGGEAVESERANSPENESDSRNNAIVNNILLDVDELLDADPGQDRGYVVQGNYEGDLSDVTFAYGAGAASTAVTAPEPLAAPVPPQDPDDGEANLLVVRAGGTGTDAATPEFEVRLDGLSLGRREIENPQATLDAADAALFREYAFEFDGAVPEQVEVVYLNDGETGGVNRDLVVDSIELNGRIFEAEQDGWFAPDNGKAIFAGARETLYVEGVLEIPVDDMLL